MFSGVVNPCTGKLEWVQHDSDVTSETADISHELARSQYGDMLLDKQRNRLYQRGLELAIAKMKASGREPHVLDIGTGTGLLSLMAAKAGAPRVTACEVLRPMVRIARQVISQNGFSKEIVVCPKRSTEMTEKDMTNSRANILVTEVFDTELIGEGALLTFAHAHKNLLEPDSLVIPSSSKMYVRLIESDFLWQSHKIIPNHLPEGIKLPTSWTECAGPPSVWDLHVEEVRVPQDMKLLSETTQVAVFDFSDPNMSPDDPIAPVGVAVSASGTCHGLVVWWDIELGDHTLSMDPWDYQQWRDHWLQAVQLWPTPVQLHKGEVVSVGLEHDDYSIWFSFNTRSAEPAVSYVDRPLCTCGVHTACSRSRVHMYNNRDRTSLYLQALREVLVGKETVVCVGDACVWPLLLLLQDRGELPGHYYCLSNSSHSTSMTKQLFEANDIPQTSVTFLEKSHTELCAEDFHGNSVDGVIGEPFFASSLLPWHNLHFWYAVNSLWSFVDEEEGVSPVVLPGKASVMAIAVNFDHLYNLRAPVGNVEEFNITAFDKAVGKHSTTPEGVEVEPHPLWEYPSYPRSSVHNLMTFDLTARIPSKSLLRGSGEIELTGQEGPCHAVVLWMDYALTDTINTTTGFKQMPGSKTEKLEWDCGFKQAVYFLTPKDVSRSLTTLNYTISFSSATGELDMTFSGVYLQQ